MEKYLVSGVCGSGKSARRFEKLLLAASEKMAREKAYSLLGANAGIKRSAIKIASVEKI